MILKLGKDAHPQPYKGMFSITRILPGRILDAQAERPTFGPLSNIDHAFMSQGLTIKMHEHVDDEILSYVDKGISYHKDSEGHEVPIERGKLMVMNAGESFWHEEKVKKNEVEMLQIFVRPEAENLEPKIQFHEKPWDNKDWYVMVGPEGSDAPMTVRQNVYIMDAHLESGDQLEIPEYPGLAPFLYVMHGELEIGRVRAERLEAVGVGDVGGAGGDVDSGGAIVGGASEARGALPPLKALKDTTLVLFFVDLDAPMSTKGTISSLTRY